ncbi:phenoloxidase-activating factor 1-like [Penaeus japonicus]|uniref:phenoloxidase-activating factor 1-like n=1 Tax=Penaeus japonicus TaxID=27405 RepID=UPI001C713C39|nr:phenoloxidase-activating factor 1-like [Penaeus japonicus]
MVSAALFFVLLVAARAEVLYGDGLPGEECEMGGGVKGHCEEVGACLRDGGVANREGVVQLCRGVGREVFVCCRKPVEVARELCESWADLWRQEDGRCVTEKPLIVGGEDANPGEFPHTAIIGRKWGDDPVIYECGGTLISPHYVLTAAHCLFGYSEGASYWVKLGEHDRHYNASQRIPRLKGALPRSLYRAGPLEAKEEEEEEEGEGAEAETAPVEQEIEMEFDVIYPHYPRRFNYHDIALVKLKRPAVLTKRVLPACLPTNTKKDYLGRSLTVVGWGHTEGMTEMSRILKKASVPVVDRLTCSSKVVSPYTIPYGITEDMLCAGTEGRDSCQGDSGGPLVEREERNGSLCEYTVVGVVSFGIGRNSMCGLLGVYTRVTSYLDWITGHIAPNSPQRKEQRVHSRSHFGKKESRRAQQGHSDHLSTVRQDVPKATDVGAINFAEGLATRDLFQRSGFDRSQQSRNAEGGQNEQANQDENATNETIDGVSDSGIILFMD